MNRRDFMRLSAVSLGTGALIQFVPNLALADGITSHLRRRNGEAPSPFSFVQLSDTHVGFNGPPDPLGTAAFERAVNVINALDPLPELVIFTGDLTHDSEDPGEHAKRFRTFREISSRLRVKTLHHVPGEHDAALDGGTLFRENFGETHYSFDHRGVHFVAIDNVSQGRPRVGKEQLAWLQKDLARYSKSTPIVVFTHRPLFDLKPEWEWFTSDGDDTMKLLAPYEAVTVLYGHIHRENHVTLGNAQHHASRSLIFGFPDPSAPEKKPLAFDKDHPFNNLGAVEITSRHISGTEGVQQILHEVTL
jgi:3',5'-cyclic AMP phosphodiesterase CpdA